MTTYYIQVPIDKKLTNAKDLFPEEIYIDYKDCERVKPKTKWSIWFDVYKVIEKVYIAKGWENSAGIESIFKEGEEVLNVSFEKVWIFDSWDYLWIYSDGWIWTIK